MNLCTENVHRRGIHKAFWDYAVNVDPNQATNNQVIQEFFSPVSLVGQTKIHTGGQVETSQV